MRGSRTPLIIARPLTAIFALAAFAGVATAAASGSFDSSFGRGGRVFASLSRDDTASGVAVQRGGGVIVSGRVGGKISVVRFDRRGRLDRAFGKGGLVREPVGSDPEEGPVRVALQSDGKVVFVGTTADLNRDRQLGDAVVVVYRLRADGKPDRSFGSRGTFLLRRHADLIGAELAIDRIGRIVAVVRFHGSNDEDGLLVLRLTRGGQLDRTFGRRGTQEVRFGRQSFLGSVTVDRRGRVYVAGSDFDRRTISVLRLTARGFLDSAFGSRGIASLPLRGDLALATAVAVQPDGRVLLAGDERFSQNRPAPCGYCDFLTLGRLTGGGRLDPTFGAAGVVHTKLELPPSGGPALALQRDGRIVVAGGIQRELSSSFLLVRLLRSGEFDPSFGDHGYTVADMRSAKRDNDMATALAVARDGRIVVAGRSARDELEGGGTSGRIQFRFALARFLP
jgi:uncharacterized delta-60 repeat protein